MAWWNYKLTTLNWAEHSCSSIQLTVITLKGIWSLNISLFLLDGYSPSCRTFSSSTTFFLDCFPVPCAFSKECSLEFSLSLVLTALPWWMDFRHGTKVCLSYAGINKFIIAKILFGLYAHIATHRWSQMFLPRHVCEFSNRVAERKLTTISNIWPFSLIWGKP